jgi:hypothetical protein
MFRPGMVSPYDRVLVWSTTLLSLAHSDARPSYYVLGYPKSGTNWVCHMLSGYLGIPVYQFWRSRLPLFSPCVLHMHRFLPFQRARRRTLYVMRDGRDIVVSDYYHRMRERDQDVAVAEDLDRYLGAGYDPDAVSENLPAFIRYMQERTLGSVDYVTHLREGLVRDYVRVRYEDLLLDTHATLSVAIGELAHEETDDERLAEAIEAQRFENVTGREAGSEGTGSFVRKGIAGDWRNVFTREAAELYDAYAGDVLIRCGYEADHRWVERCAVRGSPQTSE